eukprot:tig00020531_g10037.t1
MHASAAAPGTGAGREAGTGTGGRAGELKGPEQRRPSSCPAPSPALRGALRWGRLELEKISGKMMADGDGTVIIFGHNLHRQGRDRPFGFDVELVDILERGPYCPIIIVPEDF